MASGYRLAKRAWFARQPSENDRVRLAASVKDNERVEGSQRETFKCIEAARLSRNARPVLRERCRADQSQLADVNDEIFSAGAREEL
jgi:hypothetical protein